MPGVCPGGGMLKLRFDRYIRVILLFRAFRLGSLSMLRVIPAQADHPLFVGPLLIEIRASVFCYL